MAFLEHVYGVDFYLGIDSTRQMQKDLDKLNIFMSVMRREPWSL